MSPVDLWSQSRGFCFLGKLAGVSELVVGSRQRIVNPFGETSHVVGSSPTARSILF